VARPGPELRAAKIIDGIPPPASFAKMNNKRLISLALPFMLLSAGACAGPRGNVYPLSEGYLREADIFTRAKSLLETDPELARLNIIGFSGTENLPIYVLDIGHPQSPQNVLIVGQHHGDEVLGVEVSLAWADKLVRESRSDSQLSRLLGQFRFWIVPTLNPEAFRVVTGGLYQYKRKNNRDTDGNGRLDLRTDGVDLNRNYPVFWDEGPNLPPTDQNYKGSAPASEPEIQALISLAQKQHFEYAIFYHSSGSGAYSEKIFLPALDDGNSRQKARYDSLRVFASTLAGSLKKDYRNGHYEVGTEPGSRVGNARNYFFHIQESQALLVEIGGINSDGISVIHPAPARREKIVAKHLKALRKAFLSVIRDR